MNTRRSPKQQEQLFKQLFKTEIDAETLRKCKRIRVEMMAMHGYLYPLCDGGCPADVYNQALAGAIARAEVTRPDWKADINGDLRAALADAEMEINQLPASIRNQITPPAPRV